MKSDACYYFLIYFIVSCNGMSLVSIFDFIAFDDNFVDSSPEDDLPTLDMISRDGYPAESHVIATEDGYLLSLHRIPGGPGARPILLQHGLLGSSADWVIPGRGKSLAYLLHDDGYDVWLGNARGNTYSRAHIHWSIEDSRFWNFTFHEMGIYDLPTVINHITDSKNDSLIYIGHSMGTTMGYVMASERPDVANKVRYMISLAPVAFLGNIKSPVRRVAPYSYDIELVSRFLGVNEFLPQSIFIKYLAKYGCKLNTIEKEICENIIFAICGFDGAQFNQTLMPVILSHTPAGSSIKTMLHYAQEIVSGRFQKYDYGTEKNREVYNSTYAPDYNLTQINIPLALFYSDNDWLASPKDVKALYGKLKSNVSIHEINYPNFNHLDFLWAIDIRKLLYDPLVDLINAMRN